MILRTIMLITCFIAIHHPIARGQATEEKEIIRVVEQLFAGMEKGDSSLVRACFIKDATLAILRRDKENNPVVQRQSSIQGFLKAVGTTHPDPWHEEPWDLKIQIDDDLAQVWCDYAFYLGNKFSHCGVDAFQLAKTKEGWKIFHLAYTRRSTNCIIPKNIQRKHAP